MEEKAGAEEKFKTCLRFSLRKIQYFLPGTADLDL